MARRSGPSSRAMRCTENTTPAGSKGEFSNKPQNVSNQILNNTGTAYDFVAIADSLQEFCAFNDAEYMEPTVYGHVPNQNLHGTAQADFIIVAVPTPVDSAHQPDFSPLVSASTMVGRYMKRGSTIIYESTVFPGATEEICVPILERESGRGPSRSLNC